MEQLKEFVLKYFKIIVAVLTFALTLYIQHINNTAQIDTGQHRQSALALHKYAGMIQCIIDTCTSSPQHHQHKSKSMNQTYSDEDHYS